MHYNHREFIILWIVGMIIGIGQLLIGDSKLVWRRAIGRAIVSGGLGASASIITLWWPDAHNGALYGAAAALASLGTSGVEKIIDGWRKR